MQDLLHIDEHGYSLPLMRECRRNLYDKSIFECNTLGTEIGEVKFDERIKAIAINGICKHNFGSIVDLCNDTEEFCMFFSYEMRSNLILDGILNGVARLFSPSFYGSACAPYISFEGDKTLGVQQKTVHCNSHGYYYVVIKGTSN